MSRGDHVVLVTGTTGLVGRLFAAALLAHRRCEVVAPIRSKRRPERVRASIMEEARAIEPGLDPSVARRLTILTLPEGTTESPGMVSGLESPARELGVTEIVHCAGCLSYFNVDKLAEGNQLLTSRFLELGRRLEVRRFVYVSTAFASGYADGPIPEELHGDPPEDPNEYTRSKRITEHLVAASGLPYLILRPSIIVGDSRSGRYHGRTYGAYQVWAGLCRFLCDEYRPVIHAVAPEIPLNFVHQDALQSAFLAARDHVPDDSIVHVVSRDTAVPTTREFWHLWMRTCGQPREVRYYDRIDDLPRDRLDSAQRLLVDFTEASIEISTRRWSFRTEHLDDLRDRGLLSFTDASVQSMETCLHWFLARNRHAQRFMATAREWSGEPTIVRVSASTL